MLQTKLIWSNLGPIRVDMALDHVPKQAGVYKLTFKLWGNTYAYIGEAGARGLRARIGDYANHPPAEGDKAEHLLHELLKEAGEADLSVCSTGGNFGRAKGTAKIRERSGRRNSAGTLDVLQPGRLLGRCSDAAFCT